MGQQVLEAHEVGRAVLARELRAHLQPLARHIGPAGVGQAGGAVVRAVVVDQQIARCLGHFAADGHRAEQVAAFRIALDVGPDAKPQVVQRTLAPVARLHEGATQLQPLLQKALHAGRELEQAVRVQGLHPLLGQHLGGARHAVGTGDLQVLRVPQDQVVVVGVIAVQVAAGATALAHGAEGQLAQPPHLAQDGRIQRPAEQVDALAVRGLAQQLAGRHGLGQGAAVDRVGNRRLHLQQIGLVLGHAVQVLAQQLGGGLGLDRQAAVAAVRDRVADAQGDALLVLAEHLLDQQQRGQGLVQQRGTVEQRRIAPVDVDGHDGRLGLAGQAQEAGVPAAIAHALGVQARDLARREDDDRALALQVFHDGLELARRAAPAHHGHRQQQALERCQLGQQAVGDDLHVAPDAAHHVQQGQTVQRADGVVGDDDHAPVGGNALALVVAHGSAEGKVLQHLLHELETLQVRVLLGKAAEALLAQQPAQHAAHALAESGVPLQLRQVQVDDLVHGNHGRILAKAGCRDGRQLP